MDHRLDKIVDEYGTEVNGIIDSSPLGKIQNTVESAVKTLESCLKNYRDSLDQLDRTTVERIENFGIAEKRSADAHFYPESGGLIHIASGVGDSRIDLDVVYSGIPTGKLHWLSRFLRGNKPYSAHLKATMTYGIHSEQFHPLVIEVPHDRVKTHEDKFSDKVAAYLHTITSHAIAKSNTHATQHPHEANLFEWFETDVVCSVARFFGDSSIPMAYLRLKEETDARKETESIRNEYKHRVEELSQNILDSCAQVHKEIEKTSQSLGSHELMTTLNAYCQEQIKKISEISDKTLAEIDSYSKQRKQEIETSLERERTQRMTQLEQQVSKQFNERRSTLEREITGLEEKLAQQREQIKLRKTDIKAPLYYVDKLDAIFPDYDPQGTQYDVTKITKAAWGRKLSEISQHQDVQLHADELLGIVSALSTTVRKSEGRQKFTKPEIDELIEECVWLSRAIRHEDYTSVIERITHLGKEKKTSLREVNIYFSKILGITPREIKTLRG